MSGQLAGKATLFAVCDGVDLLSKPYTRERLGQKIAEILERPPAEVPQERPQAMIGEVVNGNDHRAKGVRVLLVEDDVLIRMATAEMLVDLGHEVVEAGTIDEASKVLGSGTVQVMLTDLGLPDGNDMDLVRRVSEAQPDMAVIIASGADLRKQVAGSGVGGRITGLVKPYDQRSLEDALRQCIGGS